MADEGDDLIHRRSAAAPRRSYVPGDDLHAGNGEAEVTIDHTFPLIEAARGHAYAETSDKSGRTILLP